MPRVGARVAGQQQLLAVARVLLKKPQVVLLDECSAAVDAHVARQMQELLHSHLAGSTLIQVPPACPLCAISAVRCVFDQQLSAVTQHMAIISNQSNGRPGMAVRCIEQHTFNSDLVVPAAMVGVIM